MTEREYVVYEETNSWPWWVVAILVVGVAGGAAVTGAAVADAVFGRVDLLVTALLFTGSIVVLGGAARTFFGRLRVVVTRTSVKIAFGYTSLIEKLITFDEIEDVEPVRYSPIREFGGWGLRTGAGGRKAWTVRGDGAVVLTLDDGTRFYVGSENPRRLAERIRSAMEAHTKTKPGSRGER